MSSSKGARAELGGLGRAKSYLLSKTKKSNLLMGDEDFPVEEKSFGPFDWENFHQLDLLFRGFDGLGHFWYLWPPSILRDFL